MNGFERLGLPADADERAVKRAYARELKRCRPEDDPEGFQELNQAYRCALRQARAQMPETAERDEEAIVADCAVADSAIAEAGSPATPGPVPVLDPIGARIAFVAPAAVAATATAPDFAAVRFLDDLREQARALPASELQRWLQAQEALYALELKQAMRAPVAHAVAGADPPWPSETVDVVLAFFALDQFDEEDARMNESLAQVHARAAASEHFRRTLQMLQSQRVKSTDRLLTRELIGPRRLPRRVWIALVPLLAPRLAATLDALERIDPHQARMQLDSESVAFWRRETDLRRVSPLRMGIVALRLAALGQLAVVSAPAAAGAIGEQVAQALAIAFLVWLCWSIGQAACLRWAPPAIASRMDRPTAALSLVLAAAAWLTPTHPVVAGVIAFFTVSLLSAADTSSERGERFWTCNLMNMTALSVFGFAAFKSAAYTPLAIVATGAVQLLHDLGLAAGRRITLAQARELRGCYGRLTAAVVLLSLAAALLIACSS